MKSKFGVVAALAAMSVRIGLPDGAYAQDAADTEERCEYYLQIDDRDALQRELEELIDLRPEDPCIGFIAGLLGGSPLAQVAPPY